MPNSAHCERKCWTNRQIFSVSTNRNEHFRLFGMQTPGRIEFVNFSNYDWEHNNYDPSLTFPIFRPTIVWDFEKVFKVITFLSFFLLYSNKLFPSLLHWSNLPRLFSLYTFTSHLYLHYTMIWRLACRVGFGLEPKRRAGDDINAETTRSFY